jgi:hypothetical protein
MIDGDFTQRTTAEWITTLEEDATESAIKLANDQDLFGKKNNRVD